MKLNKRSLRFSGVLLTKPFPDRSRSSGNSDLDSKGVKFCFLESSWCNYLEDRHERRVPLGCEVWKLNCKEVPSISVKISRVWELVSLVAVPWMLTAPEVRHTSVCRDFTIPLGVYSCCFKAHNQQSWPAPGRNALLKHGHKGLLVKEKITIQASEDTCLRCNPAAIHAGTCVKHKLENAWKCSHKRPCKLICTKKTSLHAKLNAVSVFPILKDGLEPAFDWRLNSQDFFFKFRIFTWKLFRLVRFGFSRTEN